MAPCGWATQQDAIGSICPVSVDADVRSGRADTLEWPNGFGNRLKYIAGFLARPRDHDVEIARDNVCRFDVRVIAEGLAHPSVAPAAVSIIASASIISPSDDSNA